MNLTLDAPWLVQSEDPAGVRVPAHGSEWVSTRLLLFALTTPGLPVGTVNVFSMESTGTNPALPARQRALLGWLCGMVGALGQAPDSLDAWSGDLAGSPVVFAEVQTSGGLRGRVRHRVAEWDAPPDRRVVLWVQTDESLLGCADEVFARATLRGGTLAQARAVAMPESVRGQSAPSGTAGAPSMPGTVTAGPAPVERPALVFQAPAVTGERAVELAAASRASTVVVEGSKGRGSGFVWTQGNQTWAITNVHVLAGNPGARLTTPGGTILRPGTAFAAVDHDLCKVEVLDPVPGLACIDAFDAEVKIGDGVVVLGNAEGAGVVAPIPGRVVGVGPHLVEVDAPFVQGNSGSPILHEPTGKVIGVATYLTLRSINPNRPSEVEEKVRRFGYRLDSVQTWERIDWTRFQAQAASVSAIEATSAEFIQLFRLSRSDSGQRPTLRNPGIRRAFETLEAKLAAGGRNLSPADQANVRRTFLADLRAVTRSDIQAFDQRTAYDFFRRAVEEENRFRSELYDHFSRAIEARGN